LTLSIGISARRDEIWAFLPKLFTGLLNNLFSFSAKAAIPHPLLTSFKNSLMLLSSPVLVAKLVGFENKLTDYAHDY